MKKIFYILFCFTVAFFLNACIEDEYGGIVEGYVQDSDGQGLDGVRISFLQNDTDNEIGSTNTDVNGHYKMLLDAGTYDIEYTYAADSYSEFDVVIKTCKSKKINVTL